MSKEKWKSLVKQKVESFWFNSLVQECVSMKKTQNLTYDSFSCQSYLMDLTPQDAQIIFRARLRAIKCKGNMAGSYRTDMACRLCGEFDETQEHSINCINVRKEKSCLDMSIVYDLASADPNDVMELCCRIKSFNNLIENGS